MSGDDNLIRARADRQRQVNVVLDTLTREEVVLIRQASQLAWTNGCRDGCDSIVIPATARITRGPRGIQHACGPGTPWPTHTRRDCDLVNDAADAAWQLGVRDSQQPGADTGLLLCVIQHALRHPTDHSLIVAAADRRRPASHDDEEEYQILLRHDCHVCPIECPSCSHNQSDCECYVHPIEEQP